MGKSEDGGKTWKKFEPLDKKSDEMYGDNHAMWFDKENPDRIIFGK